MKGAANRASKIYDYDNILDFGKYQGKTIDFVFENDFKYFDWLVNNVDNFNLSVSLDEDYQNKLDSTRENKEFDFFDEI